MNIAIITARGGSKRIPRKNIRDFCGRPIIAYSIASARDSGCFDEVMVSTDDEEIAEVARRHGAEVPFLRSSSTSGDYSTTADVLVEVLREYALVGERFEMGCCIYPTAPFVDAATLRAAHALLDEDPSLVTVIPVARFSYPIQRALRFRDSRVSMFQPEHLRTRSQDLEPAYHDAGQFYWFRTEPFSASPNLMGPATGALILPDTQVQDIDTEEDWAIAEIKFRALGKVDAVRNAMGGE